MKLELKNVRISIRDQEANLAHLMDQAIRIFHNSASWLMLESPREFIFRPFEEHMEVVAAREAFSLRIFGPVGELWIEKTSGLIDGHMRTLLSDPQGEECLCRRTHALLRDKPARQLVYEEYFKPEASGFLSPFCGRLYGVEDSNANW